MPRATSPSSAAQDPERERLLKAGLAVLPAYVAGFSVAIQSNQPVALGDFRRRVGELVELANHAATHMAGSDEAHNLLKRASELRALKSWNPKLPVDAGLANLVSHRIGEPLYRRTTPAGKPYPVPELMGQADLSLTIWVPAEVSLDFDEEPVKSNRPYHLMDESEPLWRISEKLKKPEYVVKGLESIYRYVVAPRSMGLLKTFRQLEQLRTWAEENAVVAHPNWPEATERPHLANERFGVLTDDDEIRKEARSLSFRVLFVESST
jgi:hypothetical protein